MTRIIRSYVAPNPKEFDYWVDLTADPKGNYIRYYAGNSQWKYINDDTDNPQTETINKLKSEVATLNSKVNKLSSDIDTILVKTETEFEALTPDANTLYLIPEE